MAFEEEIATEEFIPETGDPEPKLNSEHRKRLDSIVMNLYTQKASEDDIRAVVDDYKKKYAVVEPLPSTPSIAQVKEPQLISTAPKTEILAEKKPGFFEEVQTQYGVPSSTALIPESRNYDKLQEKVKEASDKISKVAGSHDDVKGKIVRDRQQKQYIEQLRQHNEGADVPAPDIRINETTPGEITNENISIYTDQRAARHFLKEVGKQKPELKPEIEKSTYLLDAQQALGEDERTNARTPKVLKNADAIEKGKYTYDVTNQHLMEPKGFFGSLVEGRKQMNSLLEDYDFFKSAPKEEIIAKLNDDLKSYDPLDPVVVPEGLTGIAGNFLGSNPIRSIVAGGVVSLAGLPEAAPFVAGIAGGVDMGQMKYASAFRRNYNEFKSQGLDDSEAYDRASESALKEGLVAAGTGAIMGTLGSRMGMKAEFPGWNVFKESVQKGLSQVGETTVKKTIEGLGVGGIGAGGAVIQNLIAKNAGLDRELDEGAKEQLGVGVMFTLGAALIAKAPQALSKSIRNKIVAGLAKADEAHVATELDNMQQNGLLTPEEATTAKTEIQEFKAIDQTIPDNVPEINRLKIGAKIKERALLEKQIENTDKAFHEDLKERVKKLNEDILELAKPEAKGELQKIVAKSGVEGSTAEVLKKASEEELQTYFKEIAQQAHDPATEQATIDTFGEKIVDKARELFPLTIKTEENAIQEPSAGGVLQHPQETIGETGGERIGMEPGEQGEIPAGTQPEETQSNAQNQEGVSQPEMIGITHAKMDKVARELGLDEYQKDPETIPQWDAQARERFAKDPDAVNKLIIKLRNGEGVDKVETRMMIMHIADLKARYNKNPTPELLNELKRTMDLYDISGREKGKELVARKGIVPVEESLADFHMRDVEYNKGAPLTEEQQATSTKEYEDISATQKAYEEKVAKLEAENARLKAEKAVKKTAEAKPKGEKRDYKAERGQIIVDIKEKLRKARGETSVVAVPYAKELIAIAPDVAKLVKNLVEEGIEKLPEIVKAIHAQLKEDIPDITEKDIHNIIAGEYNEKKPTRSATAEKAFNLKLEAKLVNKLEALEAGVQPKNEKQRIKRNQEIEELRTKIKDFGKEKAEAERLQKEAEVEAERLEKIAQKEADKQAKEAAKTAAREAKRKADELNKKTPEQIALQSIKNRTKNDIAKLEEQLKKNDFSEPEKEPIKLDKEAQDLRDELLKLREAREIRLMEQEYSSRSDWQKFFREADQWVSISRQIKSTGDVSMPLRQGLPGLARQLLTLPFKWDSQAKSFKFTNFQAQKQLRQEFSDMYISLAKEKVYRRIMADIKESPRFEVAQESGLKLADPNSPLVEAREEYQHPSKLEKIPGAKNVVRASNRAATVFTNKMKWNIFNDFVDIFENQGKTFRNSPDAYKEAAIYANQLVSRGHLGSKLEMANFLTSRAFFSLRLQASRLQLMFKWLNVKDFYTKTPKEVRIAYLKDMIKMIALGTTVVAAAKAAGFSVELDPRSSEFGKIKVGDTTFDVWSGFQQYVVLFSRLLAGGTKSPDTGKISPLGHDKFGQKGRDDLLLRFLRTKASPELGIGIDFLSGKTFGNKPVTLTGEALDFITPLLWKDVYEAYQDDGVSRALLTALLAGHGMGVMTYDKDEKEEAPKQSSSSKRTTRTNKGNSKRVHR